MPSKIVIEYQLIERVWEGTFFQEENLVSDEVVGIYELRTHALKQASKLNHEAMELNEPVDYIVVEARVPKTNRHWCRNFQEYIPK